LNLTVLQVRAPDARAISLLLLSFVLSLLSASPAADPPHATAPSTSTATTADAVLDSQGIGAL
jgi:hypothetical protein